MKLDVQEYCNLALLPAPGADYAALPPRLLAAERALSTNSKEGAFTHNKQLLSFLVRNFSPDSPPWKLPESVSRLYAVELRRLEYENNTQPPDYFSFQNDPFRKDIAILLHRLVPFGAEFANPYSGLPRSLAVRRGPAQLVRFLQAVLASRGIRPFLELHMHPHVVEHFHPAGWIECYEHLADFLDLNRAGRRRALLDAGQGAGLGGRDRPRPGAQLRQLRGDGEGRAGPRRRH